MSSSLVYLLLLLLVLEMVLSRPTMQRIMINNHEWEVPNEPGWEEVIKEVELVQQRIFSSCKTAAQCRQIIEEMNSIFYRYPVSKDYFETNKHNMMGLFTSIFKWG